jgi:hypothetical protein
VSCIFFAVCDNEPAPDAKLEKPIKMRKFKSLINAFEALPEDVRSARIYIKGTPRGTLYDSGKYNFALQMFFFLLFFCCHSFYYSVVFCVVIDTSKPTIKWVVVGIGI